MTELQAMYQRKGEIIHQMRDMTNLALNEKRGLSVDEDEKFKRAEADLEAVTAVIERAEKVKALSSEYEAQMSNPTDSTREMRDAFTTKTVTEPTPNAQKMDYRQAWTNYFGSEFPEDVPLEQQRMIRRGYVATPEVRGTDPQLSSTAAAGGYLSPEEWSSFVVESMKAYGGMLQVATIYNTKGGDTLHIPTEDVTSQIGAIVTQGEVDIVADTTWGEKTLGAFTYTSRIIQISQEMYAEDDAYNILRRVGNITAMRLGRKVNLDLTTGAGTTLPFGIVTDSTLGKTAAAAAAVTRSEIVDLIHSVDPAYRNGPRFGLMMKDSTLAAIRKLSFGASDDRPLWQASMREGVPDTIEGVPYWINQDMPAMTTGLKSILCGDFSKYLVRQVRGLTLSRSNERYWERRLVAYFSTMRLDGKLLDTAAVKHLIQA